jgi:ferrous iron transport protein B
MLINVVDASNLERNLYLTLQLLELGIPCVVALNMLDIAEKQKCASMSTPSPPASVAR